MRTLITTVLAFIALAAAAAAGLAFAARSGAVEAAPDIVWLSHGGNPQRTGYTLIERYTVPDGYCLHVTHTNALAEKHSPPQTTVDAGEFTVMVGDIAQSSVESNNGIAYQGQGMRNVTLLPGQHADLGFWLRPGKDPALYYYAVTMVGTKYQCS